MARPDVKDAWARQGAKPMTMTPPEFEKYLRARHREVGEGRQHGGARAE